MLQKHMLLRLFLELSLQERRTLLILKRVRRVHDALDTNPQSKQRNATHTVTLNKNATHGPCQFQASFCGKTHVFPNLLEEPSITKLTWWNKSCSAVNIPFLRWFSRKIRDRRKNAQFLAVNCERIQTTYTSMSVKMEMPWDARKNLQVNFSINYLYNRAPDSSLWVGWRTINI